MYGAISKQLKDSSDKPWVFKPKIHVFQELCEVPKLEEGNPSLSLDGNRDEDFGGTIAHTARRRGGANTILSPRMFW